MPKAWIALNLLVLVPMIASNAILFWVARQTKKAGVWPTESFFGFRRRRPFQLFAVLKLLRKKIKDTGDALEARRYRRWLNAIYLAYGLAAFALVVFLAFVPWLFSQLP